MGRGVDPGSPARAAGLEARDRTLRLRDGRRLGYAEYGDPSGPPLFLFQGTPTSRLPHHPLQTRVPVRIAIAERPGFGLSDFQPGRRLLDWPADVAQLADHLGVERFAVLGISGGGPHALACGAALPDRIECVGVASGIGPVAAPDATRGMASQRVQGLFVARRLPFLVRPLCWAFRNPARNPERFVRRFTSGFPASDRALLEGSGFREQRARSYAEATRRGVRGFAHEIAMLTRPWGFTPADVRCDVRLWHGEDDASTPLAMARAVAAALPRCEATFYPGEGHFVAVRHWDEILRALVGQRGRC